MQKRLDDKQLLSMIELALFGPPASTEVSDYILYAQLRALERLADNVFNLTATLAVIRADHLPVEQKLAQEAGARAREEW